MDFVAIDFETANESRDSACSVGLTVVRNGAIEQTISSLLRPTEMRFSPRCEQIHGITEEMVRDAPTLREFWPSISGLLQDNLVVAHNAAFDMGVLRNSLHAAKVAIPAVSYLCTHKISERAWPHLAIHRLKFLARIHNIQLDHHDASSDSKVAAELLILAMRESNLSCPLMLATHLGVRVGQIISSDEWIPSSAPSLRTTSNTIELSLPEGYNVANHPFFEKLVVFTGTLSSLTRPQAQTWVELLGGESQRGVTRKTDYLVVGEADLSRFAPGETESSSLRKARQLREDGHRIQIISDEDFLKLVSSTQDIDSEG